MRTLALVVAPWRAGGRAAPIAGLDRDARAGGAPFSARGLAFAPGRACDPFHPGEGAAP